MKRACWGWWRIDPAPRLLKWLLVALGIALLAKLLWVMGALGERDSLPVVFERAAQCREPPITAHLQRAELTAVLRPASAVDADCWRDVDLPWSEPASSLTFGTQAQAIERVWFRVRYRMPDLWPRGQPLVIHVPRTMGAAWQMRVDGESLSDNLNDWRMTWNRPLVVQVATDQIAAGRLLEIDVVTLSVQGMGHAIGRITVGPAISLQGRITLREYLQSTLPQAASATMLMLGLFFFSFWRARPAENEYLLLALSGLIWSVCNLQFLLVRSDDEALDSWYWAAVHHVPIAWLNLLIYRFAMGFSPRRVVWLERLLPWYVLCITVAALPVWPGEYDLTLLMVTLYTTFGIFCIVVISWLAIVGRSLEMKVIAVSLSSGIIAGANDLLLVARIGNPEGIFLLPYCGLAVYAAFLFAVQRRYVAAIAAHETLSATLVQRLSDRERELEANHKRLRELQRRQALAEQRQRLMRDIHDGLGSSLTSSLAAIERGRATPIEAATMLRECVDELRLVIDSLDPMEHDLVAVLATLRFRMGGRLAHVGVDLHWEMRDLPQLVWMGPHEALQVMRVMQEILNNVLKHAQATRVSLSTALVGDEVEIRCADDGQGFDLSHAATGRGLGSIIHRCNELGGRVLMTSAVPGGTEVRVRLPLVKQAPDSRPG